MSSIRAKTGLLLAMLAMLAVSATACDSSGGSMSNRDGDAKDPASPLTPPLLGVARQRLDGTDWRIVGSGDFNLDGMADVLWNDPGKNRMAIWLMSGTHLLLPGPEIPGPSGTGWIVLSPADFDDDGMIDVPWSKPGASTMAAWLMGGTEVLLPGPEIPGPSGAGWSASTAADFTYDGPADMLWYSPEEKAMALGTMGGSHLLLPGPRLPIPPGDGWLIVTAADADNDGLSDVFWYNPTTNCMAVWLMSGDQVLLPGPEIPGPSGAGWSAVTAADFNDDGMWDLIWSNAGSGSMAVWLMSGTELLLPGPVIPGPSGAGWSVAFAADFNGDGMSDAIWQNTQTNQLSVWLMKGTEVLLPGPEFPGPADSGP